MKKKEFVATVLDPNDKTFVVYIVFFVITSTNINLSYKAQIALLIQNKAFTIILSEYGDFANMFFFNLVAELLEYIGIKDYLINLIES